MRSRVMLFWEVPQVEQAEMVAPLVTAATAADSPAPVNHVPGAHDPLTDEVARQYELWVYPAPIEDLPRWLEDRWQWFDPSHAHLLLWPDRDYPDGLDILVAGCGTNQAAVIAYTNPSAHVVAIDVSEASLAHHAHLADRYALANLELHRLPVERMAELDRDFDLIISTGVLHHLANPQAGMNALASILRPEGVLAVMVYASYGRVGVQMLQSEFWDLGLGQDEESIRAVRDFLAHLDADHPVKSYLELATDWHDDAGLIDTFLHGRERSFTIDECVDLVTSAGLVFQDLFFKAPYYAHRSSSRDVIAAVADLPTQQQWSVMERLNTRNACHFFMACRADRPRGTYAIDFASEEALEYVPSMRHGCLLEDRVIHRPDWRLKLDPGRSALVQRVDGLRTIRQIMDSAIKSADFPTMGSIDHREFALQTFQDLWKYDFLAIAIGSSFKETVATHS